MPNITENRINTVMPKMVVYRLSRSELSSNIVSIQGGNDSQDTTAYLRFTMNGTGSSGLWGKFKEWWKKNNNLIIVGCMVKSVQNEGQNKGYYWCPTNRAPNPLRDDTWTNILEFFLPRKDVNIFISEQYTIYEFYFINLTH